MTTLKEHFSAFQSNLLWIALAALAASFYLDSKSAQELFGSIWLIVRQSNAVIMWLFAVLSGKKFIELLERFKKVTQETRIEAPENQISDHSEEN